jgi:tail-anchored protein insertion receptor
LVELQIMIYVFKTTEEELKLREEFRQLKNELVNVSAVDEFAKYARIKRKMNKVEEQIMSMGQTRMDGRESLRWKFTKLIQAIVVS